MKPPYTSRIIKASALIPETKALLYEWEPALSMAENLRRAREQNVLGSPSRSRLNDILPIFRRRYLYDEPAARALAILVKEKLPASALDQILYYHALEADELLRDFVIEVLRPRYQAGRADLSLNEVLGQLRQWRDEGKTAGGWSEETVARVAQGLLATLRDFGVLKGGAIKRLSPPPVALEAFAFVAFERSRAQRSGERLRSDPAWGGFFLDQGLVERYFLAAHQAGLLQYAAAGSVVRIEFPVSTPEQYARLLTHHARTDHAGTAA